MCQRVPFSCLRHLLILCLFSLPAAADSVLVGFDTDPISTLPTTYDPTTTGADVVATALTRGAGVNATSLTHAFSSSGWESASLVDAEAADEYVGFTLTTYAGYAADLSSLTFTVRRSSTGPDMLQWEYSVDGTTFHAIGAPVAFTATDSNGVAQTPLDLSAVPELQGVPETVTFRLYGWREGGTPSSSGTLAIGRLAGDDLAVLGNLTVSSVNDVSRGSGTTFSGDSFGGAAFAGSDTAVFDGTPATVTLSGAVAAASLRFDVSGYELTGTASDPLTISSGIVDMGDGVEATISGVLAGANGLTQTGNGTLTLSGANTFTGTVTVAGGTMIAVSAAALGDPDNDLTLSGGTFVSQVSYTLGSGSALSGTGQITVAADQVFTASGTVDLGAITLAGSGELDFAAPDKAAGTITFAAPGTLRTLGQSLALSGDIIVGDISDTAYLYGAVQVSGTGNTALTVAAGAGFLQGGTLFMPGRTLVISGDGTVDFSTNAATTFRTRLASAGVGSTIRLRVANAEAVGLDQFQFNGGSLVLTSPVTLSADDYDGDGTTYSPFTVSYGGRDSSPATIEGEALTVEGGFDFYDPGIEEGFSLVVDNDTTLAGTLGTAGGRGVSFGGTGSLTLSADNSGFADDITVTDGLTLVVSNTAGSGTGNGKLTVGPAAQIEGTGMVGGAADVGGYLMPGTDGGYGTLSFAGGLTLGDFSITVINVDLPSTATTSTVSMTGSGTTLTYGGSLLVVPGTNFSHGIYHLFKLGTGVTVAGGFSTVAIGAVDAPVLLDFVGGVWTTGSGEETIVFDPATGILNYGNAPVSTPLETWRQAYFGTTDNSGDAADSADPDGDGLSNLLEYATGSDPTAFNASPVVLGNDGSGHLTLTFNRIADSSLTYTVEGTNDVSATTWADTLFTSTGTDNVAGSVTVTDTVLTSSVSKRFLRLVVSY